MANLVLKFGGTSVADIAAIENAADKVYRETQNGHKVLVVVSAMAGVTNKLIEYCRDISTMHDAREYDTVLSTGEQVTSGLMAMALQKRGLMARSWLGWQLPMLTNGNHGRARISHIETQDIQKRMEGNEIPVLAGFQGVSDKNRVTTMGRGGSDTSAVAMAAALNADRCDIYTDVSGIYTTDPRIVSQACKIKKVSYEEMLELASVGAKVLQTRSVEIAMREGVALQVLSSFEEPVGSDYPGTLVTKEDDIMEKQLVSGIAYSRDEAKITLVGVPDTPGVAADIFGPLADRAINVDMIVQNISKEDKQTDMTFTIPSADLERSLEILKTDCPMLNDTQIIAESGVAKVSAVGIGMRSNAGVAQKMFKALAEKGINIQVISTSEIKVSVLIAEEYTELAVRALHTIYELEDKNR